MDRVQRMVENQKKREEAMKAKDVQSKAEVEAAKPKAAPTPAKPSAASGQSDKPMENKYSQKRAMYAPLPQTERGKPVLLGGDPQGENILYINGQNVIVRSLKNPLIASMYSEHAYAPTVARYSPCGKYIASGDSAGNIRVWNTEVVQNTVFKTTFERKMLGAGIQEIVWDPESKRMVAVGTGRETFGVGFFTDSGASLGGGITGHSKTITCCDWRPVKPYRLVTGSEDTTVCWFECPPIKWKKANKGHQRFVNSVKFNPSGSLVLSVGQDKKGFFYDGDSGDQVDEMANSHSGGIYACSWSADNSRVLTASGDRTCQIYDVAAKKTVVTFNMGDDVDDQQVGCLWQGDFLISLSLNGVLNYLDPNSGKVVKQIKGHAKSITSLAYNNATHSFYSGSYDAVINRWNEETGDAQVISGKGGHTNAVKGMAIQSSTSTLVTVGLDDAVRFTSLDAKDYTQTKSAALDSNATGVALSHKGDFSIATSLHSISVFKGTQKASSVPAPWKPQSVAFSVDDSEVAVGGEDNKVHLFSFSAGQLTEKSVLESHRGPVTTAAYSPDGKYLATADKNREIVIWEHSTKQPAIKEWVYHTARVNAVAWSPDSAHLASVSLDQNLIIWTASEPSMRINIKGAHQGSIDNVVWLDNSTVATSGQDATIRTWNINFSKAN